MPQERVESREYNWTSSPYPRRPGPGTRAGLTIRVPVAARPSGASAPTAWTPSGSPDQSPPSTVSPSSVVTRRRVPGGRSSGGRTVPPGPVLLPVQDEGRGQQTLPVGPFGRVEGGGDRLRGGCVDAQGGEDRHHGGVRHGHGDAFGRAVGGGDAVTGGETGQGHFTLRALGPPALPGAVGSLVRGAATARGGSLVRGDASGRGGSLVSGSPAGADCWGMRIRPRWWAVVVTGVSRFVSTGGTWGNDSPTHRTSFYRRNAAK
ncbi:hypothetical protein STANM309S_01979 [Streptomyces tanashiensis]